MTAGAGRGNLPAMEGRAGWRTTRCRFGRVVGAGCIIGAEAGSEARCVGVLVLLRSWDGNCRFYRH